MTETSKTRKMVRQTYAKIVHPDIDWSSSGHSTSGIFSDVVFAVLNDVNLSAATLRVVLLSPRKANFALHLKNSPGTGVFGLKMFCTVKLMEVIVPFRLVLTVLLSEAFVNVNRKVLFVVSLCGQVIVNVWVGSSQVPLAVAFFGTSRFSVL